MPSRQENKRAKRRAKYLKFRDDVLDSARASYRNKGEPEKKRTAERERYQASLGPRPLGTQLRIVYITVRSGDTGNTFVARGIRCSASPPPPPPPPPPLPSLLPPLPPSEPTKCFMYISVVFSSSVKANGMVLIRIEKPRRGF